MKRAVLGFVAGAILAGIPGLIAGYRIAMAEEHLYVASGLQWQFCDAARRGGIRELQRLHAQGAQINGEPISHNPGRIPDFMLDTLGYLAVGRPNWQRNVHGHSPLIEAAAHGEPEAVQWLLDHGAIFGETTSGETPLDLAQHKLAETRRTIEILTQHGAQ